MEQLVFTSKQIIEEMMPVLYVVHDTDGDWQFLSTFEVGEADGRVVRMQEIIRYDQRVAELLKLPKGKQARRADEHAEWNLADCSG